MNDSTIYDHRDAHPSVSPSEEPKQYPRCEACYQRHAPDDWRTHPGRTGLRELARRLGLVNGGKHE